MLLIEVAAAAANGSSESFPCQDTSVFRVHAAPRPSRGASCSFSSGPPNTRVLE